MPEELAGYSHLTGSVSSSPPGAVAALWQHGYGVEFPDFPQAVVLGAGGDGYRRVDLAEERAGGETQGDPAPMLLSPDGTRVAVGDHDIERGPWPWPLRGVLAVAAGLLAWLLARVASAGRVPSRSGSAGPPGRSDAPRRGRGRTDRPG